MIDGCERSHLARGWCSIHYVRWRKTGNTDNPTPKPAICTVDGCENAYLARGMCRKHYNREYMTDWRDRNPDYFAELAREWRRRNPEEAVRRTDEWRKRNPEKARINSLRYVSKRRALKVESQVGDVDHWAILVEHGMVCHLCTGEITGIEDLHFDHVIPLVRGGTHSNDNIRPAHARCNLKKGSKLLNVG